MVDKQELHYVNIDDKSLYQLMIADLRYSFPRDNGLASNSAAFITKKYLPLMDDMFKEATARQLIEEIIGNLNCPEINKAYKHRAISKTNNRLVYISDYEYQKKKTISEIYPFEDLLIDQELVFEDEEEWIELIKFLIPFVPGDYVPYNDVKDLYKSVKRELEDGKNI